MLESAGLGISSPGGTGNRRFWVNDNLGVGAHAEKAGDDPGGWVIGLPVIILLGAGWEFVAMPGAELTDGNSDPLIRLGAGYAFEFDSFDVRPGVNADFVDGSVRYAIGANLVFSF
jgi:hypothetical protein